MGPEVVGGVYGKSLVPSLHFAVRELQLFEKNKDDVNKQTNKKETRKLMYKNKLQLILWKNA